MKLINKLIKAIKDGNAYRASRPSYKKGYGLNLADTRKLVAKQNADLKPVMCTKTAEENELYKAGFAYWDEWTGARFSRRESPYLHMSKEDWARSILGHHKQPIIEAKSVCRANIVTGGWQPILGVL